MLDDYDTYLIHRIPMKGDLPHVAFMDCWCKPIQDEDEPTVVTHNEQTQDD